MGGIFINYRRNAPAEVVDGIYQRLRDYFGKEQVFLDRESISLGATYWDEIYKRVPDVDVLLVLVHREWFTERDENGTRLLDRERDWVREEIELGLKSGTRIIPVPLDDADWHANADLPASILSIRGNQFHRVCRESAATDVDTLIERLKSDVAPTWTPGDGGDAEPRRPGWWLGVLTGLCSLLALAGPPILVRDDSPTAPGELPPLVPTAWLFAVVMLAVPIVFLFIHVPFGKVIGSWEREVHRAPTDRYNRVVLLAAGMFLLILVWLTISTDMTDSGRLFVFVSLFITALWASVTMLRNERKDRDLDDRWPHTLGRPLRAPAVRRAMVRLDHRLTTWPRKLSREQEDKATWMLGRLTEAAQNLDAETTRRRPRWLFDDHRLGLSGYAFWISATTGFLAASAVPELRAGTATLRLWLLLAFVFAVTCLAIVLTVELGYRQHRRWRRRLAREVTETVATFRGRLDILTSPPPWDTRQK
ncbi:MAG: TIR domain-containing protein [Actinophytocola sp.]|uniref:toll/interleukin-1 receptor domain-containing protein n=1 Tax=Actinophytocola sp. TaxID=1872138 RepID=UPI001323FCF7|nr:toll/interleukin-1 receptor domain-containing protein [Actinophytocola sp.]MPZ81011.1 TIR domain-containing protein [Actinophytocola sp.]